MSTWQEEIRTAMRESGMQWTRRDAVRWDLNGPCPRCGGALSALVADVVATDSALESGKRIELLVECACGAGRGDYILVPGPVA
ncbi:hypothetical protein DMB66_03720 [Actinoplanes sp. ATCC 53533]|uniref:hypothetical protein n=1 Tax=Actinoplanes sp. ATCC 53533 TaxID=1288362 RepID=UPI000F787A1F|nr:hypothetical protein [Actinoplanes sp. ATCC 53533]RSM73148.1 hypothetical protein DMB66_03720 [Actinoplanes sp. ATCC 53533]